MRNLFLMLVLANLGFAAWHAWWGTPPGASPQRSVSEDSGITLVAEAGADAGGAENGSGADEPNRPETSESGGTAQAAAGSTAASAPGAAAARELVSERTQGRASTAATGATAAAATGARGAAATAAAASNRSAASRKAAAELPSTAAESSNTAAESSGAAAARCVSVGPFPDLAQATTASAKLRAAGYQPSQRPSEGDVWVGYWVYLDAIPSREEANRILTVLHENGVREAYGIQGDDGRIISLGVFTEIARAGRLRDQVRALGFEPKVVDRTRREDVYFIDLMLAPGRQVDFEALQAPGRITRLEQAPCPEAGA